MALASKAKILKGSTVATTEDVSTTPVAEAVVEESAAPITPIAKSPKAKTSLISKSLEASADLEAKAETQAEPVEAQAEQLQEQAVEAVTKPTTKAKTKVEGKTEESDLIEEITGQLDNMQSDEAFIKVPELLNSVDQTYFLLGGVLSKIQNESWYADKGYANFRSYIEAETGLQYRKAMYLVSIYAHLTSSGVNWNAVKELGWTILKDLAPHLTPENVDEWVEAVKGMTVLQAQEYIRAKTAGVAAGNNSDAPVADASAALTTITFKVHQDQKETIKEAVEKSKKESSTEFDSVALENICLDFLAATPKAKKEKPLSLKEQLANLGYEKAIELFNEAFSDQDLTLMTTEDYNELLAKSGS